LRLGAKTLQPVGFEADARPMSRRAPLVLLFAVLLALFPATASAQAPPPDETAAAQAFAGITLPAAQELASIRGNGKGKAKNKS
jgi:hypothetical protein